MMELSFIITIMVILAMITGYLLGRSCEKAVQKLEKEKVVHGKSPFEEATKKLNKEMAEQEKLEKERLVEKVQSLEKKLQLFTTDPNVRADELTIEAIKARLRDLSLSTVGNKADLAERLKTSQPKFWQ